MAGSSDTPLVLAARARPELRVPPKAPGRSCAAAAAAAAFAGCPRGREAPEVAPPPDVGSWDVGCCTTMPVGDEEKLLSLLAKPSAPPADWLA